MKKLSLLKTVLLLCALIVGNANAWAEDTVIFEEDFSQFTSSSTTALTSFTTGSLSWSGVANVYPEVGYIKFSSSSKKGKMTTPALSDLDGSATLTFKLGKYSSKSATLKVTINNAGTLDGEEYVTFSTASMDQNSWNNDISIEIADGTSETTITFESTSERFYLDDITVTVQGGSSSDPVINASDVEYDADVTAGEIAYTITNPVTGKSLSATTSTDWITVGVVTSTEVPFTMTENTGVLREGTITLKYDGATDKVITVTQNAYVVKYNVNISAMTNGSVVADVVAKAEAGETVTLTITPSTGYKLGEIAVTDADEGDVELSGSGNTRTFTMPAKDVTVSATFERDYSITYDFSTIDGFSGWSNSYETHVVTYDDAVVTFNSANKQTGTITDIPVTKGNDVELVLTNLGETLKSVKFVCRQWTTKTQTITLHYSTDGGDHYYEFDPEITSDDFTIESDNLPTGTNAVKISFSESNQVGIESATIEINRVVTTNAGKWTSFTPSYNATLADGATAYIITDVTGDNITATAVDVLKEGEGYFVKGTDPSTAYAVTATTDAASATTDNMIVGCTTDTDIDGTGKAKYVLGTVGTKSGLFLVNSYVTVTAGKAYLQTNIDNSNPARQLSLDFDGETTGIETMKDQKNLFDGDFFDLQGRKVAQPTKGLYIMNGKKVIIK